MIESYKNELNIKPLESRMIPLDEIEPHPDALGFWGDDDDEKAKLDKTQQELKQDTGALRNSVARNGNYTPALVVRKNDDSGWWLLDGCGRMAGAKQGGRNELYCTVLDASSEDYQKLIMDVNMSRRRVATGARVLRYLELYQEEVMAAVKENADPKRTGARGGRGNKGGTNGTASVNKGGTNGTDFSVQAITERLCCSKSEVTAGILYLRCKHEDAIPYKAEPSGPWLLRQGTADEIKRREAYMRRVRAGGTPLRTWGGGFIGKEKTDGEPRPKTDYAGCLDIATTKLNTAFTNWYEIDAEQRPGLIREFCKVMSKMPQDFDHAFLDVVKALYPALFEEKGKTK